jgi:hypothetical protein
MTQALVLATVLLHGLTSPHPHGWTEVGAQQACFCGSTCTATRTFVLTRGAAKFCRAGLCRGAVVEVTNAFPPQTGHGVLLGVNGQPKCPFEVTITDDGCVTVHGGCLLDASACRP